MEHPLRMDAEAMRRAGYATVDALVARLADPAADPVLRRASAAQMRSRLAGPAPEQPGDYAAVLERLLADVLPFASRTDHPGYFAFVPSFTTWPAALAELAAAAANPYCGAWMESAGPAQVELEVIGWFRTWLGLPDTAAGVLVTGGSAANLTALLVARDAAGGPSGDEVVYVSDQAHSSLARTARAMGLRHHQVRVLPSDGGWRLRPGAVTAAVRADRDAGRATPFALCASGGSTNTGPGHGRAPADQRAGVVAALDADPLRAVPLLSRVRGATLRALRARAARLTTAAGQEVIRRWDADRSFYIIMAGQFDVLIDGRRIRTLGPGDHFGELAARDWGGGYGYTRLATVVSAGPGELLRLTSDDFRWLVDTEPTARAAIARDLADRLPER